MIVLDTNVLSEAIRPMPSPKVLDWLRAESLSGLFTTVISEAELLLGVALLPHGRRRQSLQLLVMQILEGDFDGRILPFDSAAARDYADIAASRRRIGRRMSEPDARIAAIARSWGAAVATRNTSDFIECGVVVLDPWA